MEALRGLVDYAGLFPPAQLDLPQAIDEYRTARAGSHAWMLGRFIVPLAMLTTNTDALHEAPLSVIADADAVAGVAQLRARGARIESIEVPLSPAFAKAQAAIEAVRDLKEALERHGLSDLPAYVELPRDDGWNDLLDRALPELSQLGLRAKVRCGGVTAAAFPDVDEVAAFLAASCACGIPFKATAGLHHPIRHRDAATGFTMHGFLNLLAGAALAPNVDPATLRDVIAEEDGSAFSLDASALRWRDYTVNANTLAETRRDRFVSYGSCSFDEPVDDLIALGMLPI